MALDHPSTLAFDFLVRVANAYALLVESPQANRESGLGGKLFYAGELDEAGRALIVAANISGAATLVATADRDSQKQALRDGIADFVVTTMDEALRILKNQLRKSEPVAVCVALQPAEAEREVGERGVRPDLSRGDVPIAPFHQALMLQESEETEVDLSKIPAVVTWRVGSALPKDLAAFDEIALACLDPENWKSRRWLRLAPRYLGRMAQGLHLLDSNCEFSARFWERVSEAIDRGRIAVAFEICSYVHGLPDQFRFVPPKP